jgi:hypothetical protein
MQCLFYGSAMVCLGKELVHSSARVNQHPLYIFIYLSVSKTLVTSQRKHMKTLSPHLFALLVNSLTPSCLLLETVTSQLLIEPALTLSEWQH